MRLAPFDPTATDQAARITAAEARLADTEARVARLEAKLLRRGDDEDDALRFDAAARVVGYSPAGLRKVLKRDPDLARCYHRAPGMSSRLIFSRKALESWKASRT